MNIDWKLFFCFFLRTFISFNGNDLKHVVDNIESTIAGYVTAQAENGVEVTAEDIEVIRTVAKDALYGVFEREITPPEPEEPDDDDCDDDYDTMPEFGGCGGNGKGLIDDNEEDDDDV